MFKKLDSKYNLALTLAIIAGASALLISALNTITQPVIAENQAQSTEEAYKNIFPNLDTTKPLEIGSNAKVDAIIEVSSDDTTVGYICSATGNNNYGMVTVLVGVNTEGEIVGIEYAAFNQTPGFGDKVKTDSFMNQFPNQSADNISVDGASGATYSSKLVISLVESCGAESGLIKNEN